MASSMSAVLSIALTAAAVASLLTPAVTAATYTWQNQSGIWASPSNWAPSIPTGTDPSDVLVFSGMTTAYTSTNTLAVTPFLANQLLFQSTPTPNPGGDRITIVGGTFSLGGHLPKITQAGTVAFQINSALQIRVPLTFDGDGGDVILGGDLSGTEPIVKTGKSTLRLENAPAGRWVSRLDLKDGQVRLTGPGASNLLRSNPVALSSPTAAISSIAPLRLGALTGPTGFVGTAVAPGIADSDNFDLVVHTFEEASFGGTLRIGPSVGAGKDRGTFIVRGYGRQVLTGTFVAPGSPPGSNALQLQKDVAVGHGATLTFSGNASLDQQTAAGAIVLSGGRFELDNRATNIQSRLRDADPGSTGLDSTGGGQFTLYGHTSGTSELMGRLQLGSANNQRSGALTIAVQSANAATSTVLTFQSFSRDGSVPTYATVDFQASNATGGKIPLGQFTTGPKVMFASSPLLANGLLRNTRNANEAMVGWSTVNGSAFASYGPNGITAVPLDPMPARNGIGDATANSELRGSLALINPGGFSLNSLRIEPAGPGQQLTLDGGALNTNAILLAGTRDFTIAATTGSLGGVGTNPAAARYIHVESATLTISAPAGGSPLGIVKGGNGTLVLSGPLGGSAMYYPVVINEGILRTNPAVNLGLSAVAFRGGVLEIAGTSTFSRPITQFSGGVNWSGFDEFGSSISEDAGSGGFAAIGNDVVIDLNESGPSAITWEAPGFVRSGHALIFGSRTADRRITWSDPLGLGESSNYNAREIRVDDNPDSVTDYARISGAIYGEITNDLLKTGPGTLEVTSISPYRGATIVREGTLLVSTPGTAEDSLLMDDFAGATLGGDGTIGEVRVRPGGFVQPGSVADETGMLTTGSITFAASNSRLMLQIGDPASGFMDQLSVRGSVALGGATLVGTIAAGFVPTAGAIFPLIINDGSDPILGKFAQGDSTMIGGFLFEVSYAGDWSTNSFQGGNDVVLRAVPGTRHWHASDGWSCRCAHEEITPLEVATESPVRNPELRVHRAGAVEAPLKPGRSRSRGSRCSPRRGGRCRRRSYPR
jgi:autotransporter-associated beta strand protein